MSLADILQPDPDTPLFNAYLSEQDSHAVTDLAYGWADDGYPVTGHDGDHPESEVESPTEDEPAEDKTTEDDPDTAGESESEDTAGSDADQVGS